MNVISLNNIAFSSRKQKARAVQLYTELETLKQVNQLQTHLDDSRNMVYFTGTVGDCNEVYIPVGTEETISMSYIAAIQEELLQRHNSKRLTVAFMEGDTTTVYFSFTPGFIPPTEVSNRKRDTVIQEQDLEVDDTDEFEGEL